MDILTGHENRLSYAMAFGSAAHSVVLLFMGQILEYYQFLELPGPPWTRGVFLCDKILEMQCLCAVLHKALYISGVSKTKQSAMPLPSAPFWTLA